jgi:hypothetical protein
MTSPGWVTQRGCVGNVAFRRWAKYETGARPKAKEAQVGLRDSDAILRSVASYVAARSKVPVVIGPHHD